MKDILPRARYIKVIFKDRDMLKIKQGVFIC